MRFDVQPVCVNYFHPRNRTRRSIKLQKGERKTNKRQKDQENGELNLSFWIFLLVRHTAREKQPQMKQGGSRSCTQRYAHKTFINAM